MSDGKEMLTVMEYASKWKLNSSSVHRMLQDKRLVGTKVGKSWRIPAEALPAAVGETADAGVITSSDSSEVEVVAIAPTVEDELDTEMDRADRELELREKQKQAADMRLQLEGHITWDEFQTLRDEFKKEQEALRVANDQLTRDRVAIDKLEQAVDATQRSFDSSVRGMNGWLNRVNVLGDRAKSIIADFRASITYKRGMSDQYLVDERHPTWTLAGKSLSMDGVRVRLGDLLHLIDDFAEIPEPDFTVSEVESEDIESGPDEQEPDEADQVIEVVEKIVDETVEKVDAKMPDIIVPKRKK